MKKVAQILRSKSDPTVHTVVPSASMFDALKLMAEKNIGALLIRGGRPNGAKTHGSVFHAISQPTRSRN
jgi:predicted transcriptional regulator